MGDEKNGLLIDAMYVLYQETMAHLVCSRQNMNTDIPPLRGDIFSVSDMVFFKDHGKEKLTPQYNNTYQVLRKIGDKTVDIINNKGDVRRATFPQLKKVTPTEALITKIPVNLRFGRQVKYLKSTLPEVLKEIALDTEVSRVTSNQSNLASRKPPLRHNHLTKCQSEKITRKKPARCSATLLWCNHLHPQSTKRRI